MGGRKGRRNVYLTTGWDGEVYKDVANRLRAKHDVYEKRCWDSADYQKVLAAFISDREAMARADCCVLVEPFGPSLHLEVGFFAGTEKPLFILRLDKDRERVVDSMASKVCYSIEELIQAVGLVMRRKQPPRSSSPEVRESFDKFWSIYPRKVAKLTAEKAWFKLNPDAELADHITTQLKKHIQSWHNNSSKFIPHPATWLNARRWEDQIDEGELRSSGGGLGSSRLQPTGQYDHLGETFGVSGAEPESGSTPGIPPADASGSGGDRPGPESGDPPACLW